MEEFWIRNICFLRLIWYLSPFQCQSSESEKGWNERQAKTLPAQRMRRQDDTEEESVTAQMTRTEGLSAQRLRQEEDEEESLSFVSGVGTDSESGSKLRQGFPSKLCPN
jgi:hypothetical protein